MSSTGLHTKTLILTVLALLALTRCNRPADDSQVVAQVYDHKLMYDDIAGLAVEGLTPDDSAAIVDRYIDQWIMQMVVLSKAEKNVKTDFSAELQNYKNSLLTHAYEQKIVEQMLDTVISDGEITEYYESHPDDFQLTSSIVKAIYVKMPTKSKALPKLRSVMSKSTFGDDELLELQHLAAKYATDSYLDRDTWIPFSSLQMSVPVKAYNEELFLKKNRSIVVADDTNSYLLRIIEYRISSERSPIELQYDNIKAIILNHRKVELIRKMQSDLMREADNGGHIKRFVS